MSDINQKLLGAAIKIERAVAIDDEGWSEERQNLSDAISAFRTQAEDDAKPVDEEWLKSIGFVGAYTRYSDGPSCWFQQTKDGNSASGLNMWNNFSVAFPKTRGDVRQLLAALGVEL